MVSGAAALLLQQRPTLTPDQVKKLLTSTATPMTGADAIAQGAGPAQHHSRPPDGDTRRGHASRTPALGTGTLEGARGTAHVADPDTGVELTGERDIMGKAWSPATWTVASHRRQRLDRRHLERPHVVRLQLHRQQLDRHHLERPHVVRAHVVQRSLVRAHVVRTHVVGRDLDRADVVRRWLVRQHLVQRRLELTPTDRTATGRRDSLSVLWLSPR